MYLIWTVIIGFVAGLMGKVMTRGNEPSGFWLTGLIGVAGAVVCHQAGLWAGWYKGMVRDRIIESLGKAPRKPAQVVGADDQDVLHGSGNKGTSWVEEDESDEAPASGTGVRAADRDDPGAAGKKDAGEQASLW